MLFVYSALIHHSFYIVSSGYMIHANMVYCYEVDRSGFVFYPLMGTATLSVSARVCKGPLNGEEKEKTKHGNI